MARPNIKIEARTTLPDIPKRDEYSFLLEFTEPSTDVDVPIPIGGWTFVTTLKSDVLPDDPDDADVAFRRYDTVPSGAEATAGRYTVTLTGGAGGDTDVAPGDYVLTVRRILSGTNPWVVHQQFIRILPTGAQKFTA